MVSIALAQVVLFGPAEDAKTFTVPPLIFQTALAILFHFLMLVIPKALMFSPDAVTPVTIAPPETSI